MRPGELDRPFALSPDGKTLASAESGWVRLWDIETGKEVRAVAVPDALWIRQVTFSQDGANVIVVADKRPRAHTGNGFPSYAYLVEVRSGKLRHRLGDQDVDAALFLDQGKLLVTRDGRGYFTRLDEGNEMVVWDCATGKSRHSLTGVLSFAASADGKLLATRLADGTIRLWDVPRWRELRSFKVPGDQFDPLAVSPDGRVLAAGYPVDHPGINSKERKQYAIRVWDTCTGKVLHELMGDGRRVDHLRFSPDGGTLLSSTNTHFRESIHFWDVRSGTMRFCLPDHFSSECAFAQDGKRLFHARADTLSEVQTSTGKLLRHWKLPDRRWWYNLAVTPDATRLVLGGNGLTVWDLTKEQQLHPVDGHSNAVERLFFSPDARSMASVDSVGSLRLWNVQTGRLLPHFKPEGSFWVSDCIFREEDGSLAVAASDVKLRIWEVPSGRLLRTLDEGTERSWDHGRATGHLPVIVPRYPPSFDPLGRTLFISGGERWGCATWDVVRGKQGVRLPISDELGISLKWSCDGRRLVTASLRKQLAFWELPSGKCLAELEGQGKDSWFFDFSPDGSVLAWGSERTVRVRECKGNREISRLVLPQQEIDQVAVERDNRSVILFIREGPALLWDMKTGEHLECIAGLRSVPGYWYPRRSPDGQLLIPVPAGEGQERIHEAATGRPIGIVGEHDRWTLSRDGRLLAFGESSISIVETRTGTLVARLSGGHRGRITALSFSPDGRLLATGGSDSTILVWDLEELCGLRPAGGKREPVQLWRDLASPDGAVAYRAVGELSANPQRALQLLGEHLRPVREEDAAPLRRRLRDLDDQRFAVRQRASEELEKLTAEWEFLLREALLTLPTPELRQRLEPVRKSPVIRKFSPEALQALRGVQVLERIGTADARRLLKQLAEGLPGARLTQDAKDALRRLEGQAVR